ncbi:MAG: hypothetical protein RL094_401 [Candidatus Parcubacteria bacterium]|jgi:thiamine biosynthesis lipoprotein
MTHFQFAFRAIGTEWKIDFIESDVIASDSIANVVKARIEHFEETYSRFRDGSLIAQIRKTAGTYNLPTDAGPMLSLYEKLYSITHGKMTPLIGQVLVDAGYDAQYSLTPKEKILPAKKWKDVMEYHNDGPHPKLIIKEPVSLDFGALGKGHIIDIVGQLMTDSGIEEYTINAGGDILHTSKDKIPQQIGLEDPRDTSKAIGVATIVNKSICGSAGNRRTWNKFHHVIDAHSVESPRHITALWVVAETTLLADALTTALFFVSPEKLQKEFHFDYAILHADGSLTHSIAFPGGFFTE